VTIFGVSWDELALEHVDAFLADADDEPYLWEAKGGGARLHSRSVRKAVSGFANSRGGWLIIGADQNDDDTWTLPGVDFGAEEPRTWVDSVIRDGMSPVPDHDTKPLSSAGGRNQSPCCVGEWYPPIWSANGKSIAVSADSAGGIFLMDRNGNHRRKLSEAATEIAWQTIPRRR